MVLQKYKTKYLIYLSKYLLYSDNIYKLLNINLLILITSIVIS